MASVLDPRMLVGFTLHSSTPCSRDQANRARGQANTGHEEQTREGQCTAREIEHSIEERQRAKSEQQSNKLHHAAFELVGGNPLGQAGDNLNSGSGKEKR